MSGTIDPSTKLLVAAGMIRGKCGSIEITGSFTTDLVSVSGSYNYSKGGGGEQNCGDDNDLISQPHDCRLSVVGATVLAVVL